MLEIKITIGHIHASLTVPPCRLLIMWGNWEWGNGIIDIHPRWTPDNSLPWRWRTETNPPVVSGDIDDDDIPF